MSLIAFLAFGYQMLLNQKEFRRWRDHSVIHLKLAYKQETFANILQDWIKARGSGAILAFRRQLWYDNFWAISYAVLFSSFIALLTIQPNQEPGTIVLVIFVLPLLAGLIDILLENSLYLITLRGVASSDQVVSLPETPIRIASIAARIKFSLLLIAAAGLLLIKLSNALPSLQSFHQSMSSWLVTFISLMTVLLFILVLFPAASQKYSGKSDPHIIKLQLAFTKPRFTNVLLAWYESRGSAAIPEFRKSVKQLDFIFPIVYAVFFSSFIASLTSGSLEEPDQNAYLLFLLPFAAALFDWIENLLHLRLLKGVDTRMEIESLSQIQILAASIAASLKWALVLISLFSIILLLVN